MSDLEMKECIVNAESFQSIQQIFKMISLNKNLIATSDTFLGTEATLLSLLKELVTTRLDNNADESENFLELFLTNQLYAMTIQIHSLADLIAQLIYELRLVSLTRGRTELTIDKITFSKVLDELALDSSGRYALLLTKLSCFEDNDFKYFASLSNTFKHKFIPVTNHGGHAISGGMAETGFQIDMFLTHEGGQQTVFAAEFIIQIIDKYDHFKSLVDPVFIELNNLVQ